MSILSTKQLTKQYGTEPNIVKALDGVSISIEPGEFVAIIGTSGSGKSTLLNMLGGLDRPTSGSVRVDNYELGKLKDEDLTVFRRQRIGFIFQNYNLVPVLNVYENIVMPIQLDGKKPDQKFIKEIVALLGLEKKLYNMPNTLSGGQQQRVAIARALASKPAIILADGVIGQMMEKVVLPVQKPRRTDAEVIEQCPWATTGRTNGRKPNVITSLELKPEEMEKNNIRFQAKYKQIEENEVRFEEIHCDDADYLIVAFGSMARIGQKAMELAREEGIKVGMLRPITLWPFPTKAIAAYADKVKGMLVTELNAGQMVEDVRLAVNGKVKVEHFGRLGGIVPDPDEIVDALKEKLIKK